jgi:hypothetical protein
MNDEEGNGTRWSKEPVCSCSGGGNPTMVDGIEYVFRNPSCRIHRTTLSTSTIPVSADRVVGNLVGREKER